MMVGMRRAEKNSKKRRRKNSRSWWEGERMTNTNGCSQKVTFMVMDLRVLAQPSGSRLILVHILNRCNTRVVAWDLTKSTVEQIREHNKIFYSRRTSKNTMIPQLPYLLYSNPNKNNRHFPPESYLQSPNHHQPTITYHQQQRQIHQDDHVRRTLPSTTPVEPR